MEYQQEMEEQYEVSSVLDDSTPFECVEQDEANPVEIEPEVMAEAPQNDLQEAVEGDETLQIPKFKTDFGNLALDAMSIFMKSQVKGEALARSQHIRLVQNTINVEGLKSIIDQLKRLNETMQSQLKLERLDRYRVEEESKKLTTYLHNLKERAALISRDLVAVQNANLTLGIKQQQIIEKSKSVDTKYQNENSTCKRLLEETQKKIVSNQAFREDELRKQNEILTNLRHEQEKIVSQNASLEEELKENTVKNETIKVNCAVGLEKNEQLRQEEQTILDTLSNHKMCFDTLQQQFDDQDTICKGKMTNLETAKLKMKKQQSILDEKKCLNDELSGKVDTAIKSFETTSAQYANSLLEHQMKIAELTKRLSDNIMLENAAVQQLEDLKVSYNSVQEEVVNYQQTFDELAGLLKKDEVAYGSLNSHKLFLENQISALCTERERVQQTKTHLMQLISAKKDYTECTEKLETILTQLEKDWLQHKSNVDEKLAAVKKSNLQKLTSRAETLELDRTHAEHLKRTIAQVRKQYIDKCAKSDIIHKGYQEVAKEVEELKAKQAGALIKKTPQRTAGPSGVRTVQRKGILKKPNQPIDDPPPKKVSFVHQVSKDSESDNESMDAFLETLCNKWGSKKTQPTTKTTDELFDNLKGTGGSNSPPERERKDS